MRITSGENTSGGQFLFKTLVLLIIVLLVLFVFVVRTEKARSILEWYLSEKTGMDVKIGRCRIVLPYDLEIDDIKTVGFGDGNIGAKAGFQARSIKFAVRIPIRLRLTIKSLLIRLVENHEKKWEPQLLAMLGDMVVMNENTMRESIAKMAKEADMKIIDSRIEWIGDDNTVIAVADGIEGSMCKVRTINGKIFYYCKISAEEYEITGHKMFRDFNREWFVSADGNAFEPVADIKEAVDENITEIQ